MTLIAKQNDSIRKEKYSSLSFLSTDAKVHNITGENES